MFVLFLISCNETRKNTFFQNFFLKTFGGNENSLYLCTRFTKQAVWLARVRRQGKEFFEKIYIYREVVQEASGVIFIIISDG